MTAEKACPFISAIRQASMHVRLILQQLFVNHPPSSSSRWLDKWERFWPQMCASSCLPFDVQWFSVGERARPQATAPSEGSSGRKKREDSQSTAKRSLRHGCFMWSEDVRSCTSCFKHPARRPVLPNIHA